MSSDFFDITITGTDKMQSFEELIKVFLPPSRFRLSDGVTEPAELPSSAGTGVVRLRYHMEADPDQVSREIYRDLSRATGKAPKWGILTGIRPVKLVYELAFGDKSRIAFAPAHGGDDADDRQGVRSEEEALGRARRFMEERCLVHPDKAGLAEEILRYQRGICGNPPEKSMSLYVGIPFCPSRCLYCSFTSNQVGEEEIRRYLQALMKEVRFAGEASQQAGYRIESVYMGGGTPTTLTASQLDRLLREIRDAFGLDRETLLRECTVEAGRPDTITADKLAVMKARGVDRISINPQTMRQETLERIGRRHTTEQTEEAYRLAREAGFTCINTDLIAGLPGEDLSDFACSLDRVLELGADNITLHTLAVKRASRLKEADEDYHYRAEELREGMLTGAAAALRERGFRPYYLYRQKHTSGSTENTGYCREDKVSIYNVRIMEERQSILALGAGGISKVWFPRENRLERVANVSNYEIYIERIDEMIERKRKKFFGGENHVDKRT